MTPTFALVSRRRGRDASPRSRGTRRRSGPAVLRMHAGVRSCAVEAEVERAARAGSEDDFADRRALVVHVAVVATSLSWSNASAPRSHTSSCGVNRSSIPRPRPSSSRRRTASSMTTTAALLSEPRIVPARCGRCRPRRRPGRSPPRAAPCRCAHRGRSAFPRLCSRAGSGSRCSPHRRRGARRRRPRPTAARGRRGTRRRGPRRRARCPDGLG